MEQACWSLFSFVWMVLYFPQSCHDSGCMKTKWSYCIWKPSVREGLPQHWPAPPNVRGAWKKMAKRPKNSCEFDFINCSCHFSLFVYIPAWCCFCDHVAYFYCFFFVFKLFVSIFFFWSRLLNVTWKWFCFTRLWLFTDFVRLVLYVRLTV